MHRILVVLMACTPFWSTAQSFTNYHTGNTTDLQASPEGGICLMGGATENDEAMRWFLERADGGDVLVLRASGSDGYNNYFYSTLGVSLNSVETIVFNNASASNDAYVQQAVAEAEAIWFAGGDQWDYVTYWRGTAIDSLINDGIQNRNLVIGGTSAGMAIQGGYYFTAQNGTITSTSAMNNPFDTDLTVDNAPFLNNAILGDVITDTHYDNPDRKGRQMAFMARMFNDDGVMAKGIACDEYTAVCIDENGIARVYGEHPSFDDNAYFLQVNCELQDPTPEQITSGQPLLWDHGGAAVKVYAVKGTNQGSNTFDLNDWLTGSGGVWQDWSVSNGSVIESNGNAPNCAVGIGEQNEIALEVYPNPSSGIVYINPETQVQRIEVRNALGQLVLNPSGASRTLNIEQLPEGWYTLFVLTQEGVQSVPLLKQ